jgi:hypothetical protein
MIRGDRADMRRAASSITCQTPPCPELTIPLFWINIHFSLSDS